MEKIAIVWLRRDLRLFDNTALHHALKGDLPVLPLFIFDSNILEELPRKDARVSFIHSVLLDMDEQLKGKSAGLLVEHGTPQQVWQKLTDTYNIGAVYTNRDYEPYARKRDKEIGEYLSSKGVAFHTFKDHVILEPGEVLKDDGDPYVVFTPFSKRWREALKPSDLESHPSALYFDNWAIRPDKPIPTLAELGFEPTDIEIPDTQVADELIEHYKDRRDIPGIRGTSRMSVHLRFGTVSIRQLATQAQGLSFTYMNELIWREFYQTILWHFPYVVGNAFRSQYDRIEWRNNEKEFEAWKQGQTGYPMVDAGMRELNATGFMHNRTRMVVASFLTKHLLIDWRWGEAYFAEKLLDFDLAANNGGWQWAAGCGTDAAPYFRVFNPESQQKKFDPQGKYILKWVPEYGTPAYPRPIVDHKLARERVLKTYKIALDAR